MALLQCIDQLHETSDMVWLQKCLYIMIITALIGSTSIIHYILNYIKLANIADRKEGNVDVIRKY
jgi:hypothetical protein